MKESIQFTIAAILLSIGIAKIPSDASSAIVAKGSVMRQTAQEQQSREDLSKRLAPQWRYSTDKRGTFSMGKSPALLWHRFSLMPQPVFFHWLTTSPQ